MINKFNRLPAAAIFCLLFTGCKIGSLTEALETPKTETPGTDNKTAPVLSGVSVKDTSTETPSFLLTFTANKDGTLYCLVRPKANVQALPVDALYLQSPDAYSLYGTYRAISGVNTISLPEEDDCSVGEEEFKFGIDYNVYIVLFDSEDTASNLEEVSLTIKPDPFSGLAAAINAINAGAAKYTPYSGKVVLEKNLDLTGKTLEVPAAVTLELQNTVTLGAGTVLTVNGTVNAAPGKLLVTAAPAAPALIDGSGGTIALLEQGVLLPVPAGKALILDGVCCKGLTPNSSLLVTVNGTLTMRDGEIAGNSGGGISVGSAGKFYLRGGIVWGNDGPDGKKNEIASLNVTQGGEAKYYDAEGDNIISGGYGMETATLTGPVEVSNLESEAASDTGVRLLWTDPAPDLVFDHIEIEVYNLGSAASLPSSLENRPYFTVTVDKGVGERTINGLASISSTYYAFLVRTVNAAGNKSRAGALIYNPIGNALALANKLGATVNGTAVTLEYRTQQQLVTDNLTVHRDVTLTVEVLLSVTGTVTVNGTIQTSGIGELSVKTAASLLALLNAVHDSGTFNIGISGPVTLTVPAVIKPNVSAAINTGGTLVVDGCTLTVNGTLAVAGGKAGTANSGKIVIAESSPALTGANLTSMLDSSRIQGALNIELGGDMSVSQEMRIPAEAVVTFLEGKTISTTDTGKVYVSSGTNFMNILRAHPPAGSSLNVVLGSDITLSAVVPISATVTVTTAPAATITTTGAGKVSVTTFVNFNNVLSAAPAAPNTLSVEIGETINAITGGLTIPDTALLSAAAGKTLGTTADGKIAVSSGQSLKAVFGVAPDAPGVLAVELNGNITVDSALSIPEAVVLTKAPAATITTTGAGKVTVTTFGNLNTVLGAAPASEGVLNVDIADTISIVESITIPSRAAVTLLAGKTLLVTTGQFSPITVGRLTIDGSIVVQPAGKITTPLSGSGKVIVSNIANLKAVLGAALDVLAIEVNGLAAGDRLCEALTVPASAELTIGDSTTLSIYQDDIDQNLGALIVKGKLQIPGSGKIAAITRGTVELANTNKADNLANLNCVLEKAVTAYPLTVNITEDITYESGDAPVIPGGVILSVGKASPAVTLTLPPAGLGAGEGFISTAGTGRVKTIVSNLAGVLGAAGTRPLAVILGESGNVTAPLSIPAGASVTVAGAMTLTLSEGGSIVLDGAASGAGRLVLTGGSTPAARAVLTINTGAESGALGTNGSITVTGGEITITGPVSGAGEWVVTGTAGSLDSAGFFGISTTPKAFTSIQSSGSDVIFQGGVSGAATLDSTSMLRADS
ncbi:MAG: hypothetical protein LBR16_04585 [Treponema sp.]|jgi:hypothetical protein|nr:hypothetical protein [Treponema sp.]